MGEDLLEIRKDGRDEMNLAEFPMGLLTDAVPDGLKTLVFEAEGGKLTITGSDAHGLPTPKDTDVVLGLLALTKARNDFSEPTVTFEKSELLDLMGWDGAGRNPGYYDRRLEESLSRWMGVLFVFDKSWWANDKKKKSSEMLHVLEHVKIEADGSASFTWNKVIFASFRANNVRKLDLDAYFALKTPTGRQMYRFLGKRFYGRDDLSFDLSEFAFGRVGLTRTYEGKVGKIKEKLRPAIAELEEIGFLRPMSEAERYIKKGKGQWDVRFVKGGEGAASLEAGLTPEPEPPGQVAELTSRGVGKIVARRLVAEFDGARIARSVSYVDGLKLKLGKVPGTLVNVIREDRAAAPPKSATSQDRLPLKAADPTPEERGEAEVIARVAARWESLDDASRKRVKAKAWAWASPEKKAAVEVASPRSRRLLENGLVEDYLRHCEV